MTNKTKNRIENAIVSLIFWIPAVLFLISIFK